MLKSLTVSLLALVALLPTARAADAVDPLLPELVGNRLLLLARFDLDRLTSDQVTVAMSLVSTATFSVDTISREQFRSAIEGLKQAGAGRCYLLIDTADGNPGPQVASLAPPGTGRPSKFSIAPLTLAAPVQNKQEADKLFDVIRQLAGPAVERQVAFEFRDGVALITPQGRLEQARADDATMVESLRAALAVDNEAPLVLALAPTADQRRVYQQLLPLSLPTLGGANMAQLFAQARWFAVTVNPSASFALTIQTGSPEGAKVAETALNEWLAKFQPALAKQPVTASLAKLLAEIHPRVEGDRLVAKAEGADMAAIDRALSPAVQAADTAMRRTEATNHLKTIGLAMFNYLDRDKHFPNAAIRDNDGKPLLSWRVAILPYLDQEALYKQFKLDEPWDSEHNRQLIAKMPTSYQLGSLKNVAAGKTVVQLPIGQHTAFPDGRGLEIKNFTDGTSNTILVVEAADDRAVEWTKPEDLQYDPEHPRAGLGGHFGEGFLATYADGSVRFIDAKTSDDKLKALFTAAGKEPISQN